LMRPLPPASLWPLVWIAVAAAVCALLTPARWLAVPAGVTAAVWLMTRHNYGQSWIWQQSYDRLYLTVPLVAVAAAFPARILQRRVVVWIAALLMSLVWIRVAPPILAARTTDHLEYRWLRQQFAAIPAECRIIHLASADKRGLFVPTYVGPSSRQAV